MIWSILAVLLLALAAYLAAWPVPIEPLPWSPGPDPGYSGPFAENRELAGLRRIELNGRSGPEHLAFGPDGRLYTGVLNGEILSMNADGGDVRVFARTDGRVLGLNFDALGRLWAADAMRGLLCVERDGVIAPVVESFDGEPVLLANAVIVATNGLVYFTDSSRRFGARRWGSAFEASKRDILEQSATGRVLRHDPATGETRLVASGISFANGIALSTDERWLFVNETGKNRIWRLPVAALSLDVSKGPAGGATILIDNLPGYPDNLMRGLPGADGAPRVWCGLVKPRNPALDKIARKPFLRKVALRLPAALQPIPRDYSHIFAFNDRGEIVVSLQDPAGAYPETTSAVEWGDRLYVASLKADWLGWRDRPQEEPTP